MKRFRLSCLLYLILATFAKVFAEGEAVATLSISDGLTGETVNAVTTDSHGMTWIATNSGVNVFNGKQLHSFVITGEQGRALEVVDLCEVTQQRMYAATEDGLWCMLQGRDHFERVLPEVKRPLCLLALGDTLLIGSEQGLMLTDGQRLLRHTDVSVSRHGLDNIVRQFDVDSDGTIWFLGRFDLNSYDPTTGDIVRYPLPDPLSSSILTEFASLGQRRFAVGTSGGGLYLCDLTAQTAEHVSGVGNLVTSVRRSSDGYLCVATDGAGAYLIPTPDPSRAGGEVGYLQGENSIAELSELPSLKGGVGGGFLGALGIGFHFSTSGDALHRLPSNGVYCYYRDPNGVNWFGFVRYGLAYTYHSETLFQIFTVDPTPNPSPARGGESKGFTTEGMNVRCGYRHGEHLLFGTQNGFYYVNSQTHQSRYYGPTELGGGHIVNTMTWHDGRFYIGTFDGGLHVLNPETGELRPALFHPELAHASIGDVKTGPDGRLWIGCSSGLMIVAGGRVEQHFTEQNSRIVSGLILSITFDGQGNAWLTGEGGCSLYSVRSNEIVETNFPEGFFNRQPWMLGAPGHDGLVFMRTGPQTFYTNADMTDFGELPLPFRFRDKWCRSFVDTNQGYYILTSERGLFSFSYDMQEVLHFGAGEGLRGDFINSLFLDSDHTLWVATSQGLFIADMQRFTAWKANDRYHVQLYNIRRGSDLMSQAEDFIAANQQHDIRLRWNLASQVMQAELLLPDYARHRDRLYEYRLGGDGAWQYADDGQPIEIRRLTPGRHHLEVRLAGAPGTASVYTLTVVPSVWVYVELLLLVMALAMLFFVQRYRKRSRDLLSERNDMEKAILEAEEELNSVERNSTLYTLNSTLKNKYQKVRIDEAECEEIVGRMRSYIEQNKVYTNVDLKMKDIADELRLSPSKLSQVFSLYLNENYYDFINRYRLDEFKRLIAAGAHRQFTITALSEQCGFKKSNFFSTFRKVEGMTPAEYLRKNG